MNYHTTNPTPRKMSLLDYARLIEQTQGPQAPANFVTVAELIEILEAQAQPAGLVLFTVEA